MNKCSMSHATLSEAMSVDEMAAQLQKLLESQAPLSANASAAERHRHQYAERRRSMNIAALRQQLATEFQRCHNWQLSNKAFSPLVLARGGVWDGRGICAIACWPVEFADHPFFFRRHTRAAALVSHPYNCTPVQQEAAKIWADQQGLSVSFPKDFPSWWYPGSTTLVAFTPRTEAGDAHP